MDCWLCIELFKTIKWMPDGVYNVFQPMYKTIQITNRESDYLLIFHPNLLFYFTYFSHYHSVITYTKKTVHIIHKNTIVQK